MERPLIFAILTSALPLAAADIWTDLNATVDGRLHQATPFALPCFASYNGQPHAVDEADCSAVRSNYSSGTARSNLFSGFMNSQGEVCFSNATEQCLLDNSVTPSPQPAPGQVCYQGTVPDYYIEVAEASDVISALDFAKANAVRLSIKNSGHDYMTRNSQKGSLSLWVRGLQDMTYHSAFVPDGCSDGSNAEAAITTAAGVNFDQVYKFAESNNATFIGGYASTIGASGGWVQGGGHSVLSPVYGLGIDRVLQYKVVTPDGVFRTANKYQNQDLFWALRGGGAGTFGVVLESTHKVEPRIPIAVASIAMPSTTSRDARVQWLDLVVNSSLRWGQEGWGGHITSTTLINMNPLQNLEEAMASVAEASAFALAHNGTSKVELLPSWYDVYTKYVVPSQRGVGGIRFLNSRLIPASLFATEEGRAKVLAFLVHVYDDYKIDPYIPVDTPYLYKQEPGATSATPAWRGSLWSLGLGMSIPWNSTDTQRFDILTNLAKLTIELEEFTGKGPQGGSYMNEASPFTQEWKEDFWGLDNYEKLLSVKKKYDPEGLLSCWKCIGFDEQMEKEDAFACMGNVQKALDGALGGV